MIKEHRKAAGLTQKQFSELFDPPIPINTIKKWDSGLSYPPVWIEKIIIEALERKKFQSNNCKCVTVEENKERGFRNKSNPKYPIEKARIAAGLTQKQFSELFEIPLDTVKGWDSGRRKPPEWAERLIIKELERMKGE